jgi:DNA polymerase-1
MHRAGVRVDLPYLRNLGAELDQRLDELRRQIHQSVGMEFNIASLKQLNEVLFDKLKLPSKGLSKTIHGYSLDAEALEGMADKHPMIPILLEWRSLEKLKNTYVDALLEQADSTERVHTVYNQTGAITGRLSSENPNLQNIPTRTEEGRRVRRAFIAKPGYQLISVDYSQIELRILAHFSGDPFMTDAFARNQDIHAATAAAVFNIPYEQVTKDQRYLAKRINFGLMYGMGAFRLGKEANLSTSQATEFIRQYFARLPKIEQYLRESKEQAVERGYLETLFGRRRRFDVLQESRRDQVSSAQRASAEREAINMPVQGTNADIIKKAMIELFEQLRTGNYQAQLLLQVHDELVLEVPDQEVSAVAKLVQSIMGNAARLSVPLATEAKVGDNWRDMTPV